MKDVNSIYESVQKQVNSREYRPTAEEISLVGDYVFAKTGNIYLPQKAKGRCPDCIRDLFKEFLNIYTPENINEKKPKRPRISK